MLPMEHMPLNYHNLKKIYFPRVYLSGNFMSSKKMRNIILIYYHSTEATNGQ